MGISNVNTLRRKNESTLDAVQLLLKNIHISSFVNYSKLFLKV